MTKYFLRPLYKVYLIDFYPISKSGILFYPLSLCSFIRILHTTVAIRPNFSLFTICSILKWVTNFICNEFPLVCMFPLVFIAKHEPFENCTAYINTLCCKRCSIPGDLYHRFTQLCVSFSRVGNASCVTDVWSPYRITPIHWLMARRRLWRNHVVSLWRTHHPLLRFLCLDEAVTLPFVVAIFWPKNIVFRMRFIHLHFGDCLQWNFVLLAVKCHGISPLPTAVRAIPSDPHSKCVKCLGFSHARDAVYGVSKCKLCENLRLITLRSRLEVCEESSIFPHRAPEASAASRESVVSRESTTWGSDVELEEMESEQTGLAFSLPPSPERVRVNSAVEFKQDYLFPSPRVRDTVSFGIDDILLTAASDSEDLGPTLADTLPLSSQEARFEFQTGAEEAAVFRWSASGDLQILETAVLFLPY